MRLEVLADRRAVAARAAERIARVLRRRGPRRLVLASGKTVVPIYEALVRLHRLGRAPFGRAETFNLDELRRKHELLWDAGYAPLKRTGDNMIWIQQSDWYESLRRARERQG